MNIPGRKKHHICTVVIRKNSVIQKIIPIICILSGLLLTGMPQNVGKLLISPVAKTSVNIRFPKEKSKKISSFSAIDSMYSTLKASSPIFGNMSKQTTEDESDSPPTNKNENGEVQKNEYIQEKSIVSSNLKISNATSYDIDARAFVSSNVTYNAVSQSKKILIVHTHGCETYCDDSGKGLGDSGTYRTKDMTKNVTSVGKILADHLEKRGLSVVYDSTLCDYPSYNASYKTSMDVIEKHLKENPDIRFVFDIHRDAIADSDSNPIKLTANINGQNYAQIMIVCGTDASGLKHPNWKENLTLALKIQEKLEEKYPGLARPLNIREERFNMHETKGSLIFEIGTHGNTLEEAQKSGILLADAISDVICN